MNMTVIREAGAVAAIAAAILLGTFRLWRQMRLDSQEEAIFDFNFWLVAGGAIGAAFGGIVKAWWWGLGMGAVLAAYIYCRRNKWNFWEVWDEAAGVIFWVAAVAAAGVGMWFEVIVLAGGVGVTFITGKTYRKLRWYKSGKPGFIGLFGVIWLGLGEAVIAFSNPHKIYWVGLNLIAVAIGILAIYWRSRLGHQQ